MPTMLKLPTVDKFLNYLPLAIGGYFIGGINLIANIFAAILQIRNTIAMNLKEFHGTSEQHVCKSNAFYGFNELTSSNTFLSAFICYYLIIGVMTRNTTKMLPFMVYLGVYTFCSFIHMMSVHEGHVAVGFLLAAFHAYSFIVIYSLMMQFIEGPPEDPPVGKEEEKDEEAGLTEMEEYEKVDE